MIVEIIGRAADIILIAAMLGQILIGLRVSETVVLCLRHRRAGVAREHAALAQPLPDDETLPAILVQIPTYNEGALVERALSAATALDWPRERLQIQLLDDSTDASAEIARATTAEFRQRGHDVVLLQRADRAGFKAGALKAGLAVTDQPFIAMFDADYVPEADFLRQCMAPLLADSELAFAQARCDFLNAQQNLMTQAQQVILESHFACEQATRSWAGQFLPFNGTCGIWRRAAIESVGGWQGDTLTEDLDLSLRAHLQGWRAMYLASVTVPGELPDTLATWDTQQRRWNMGYAQTARKLLTPVWRSDLPLRRKVDATLHLAGCVYGPLLVTAICATIIDLACGTMSYAVFVPIALLGLVQGAVGAVCLAKFSGDLIRRPGGETRRRGERLLITLYTMLLHIRAGALSARSVLDGMTGRTSSFVRTPKRDSVRGSRSPSPPADAGEARRTVASRAAGADLVLNAPAPPAGDAR